MKRRFATNLHRLWVRQVQVARDGDYTDGGGLILRVKERLCSLGAAIHCTKRTAAKWDLSVSTPTTRKPSAIRLHPCQQAQNVRSMHAAEH